MENNIEQKIMNYSNYHMKTYFLNKDVQFPWVKYLNELLSTRSREYILTFHIYNASDSIFIDTTFQFCLKYALNSVAPLDQKFY
jgi:hypothetical protein